MASNEAAVSDDERIQPALHALLTEDIDGLRAALKADPGVVNLKIGENTMLELMTQPEGGPPSPDVVQVLIDAGADLDRALNLAGCWNLADLCAQLLAAGADPAARADAGITPLESAAMHSSAEAADVLVVHGLHRPSLWLAAASGLLPEVRQWVSPDGSLQADPGPYRPNWADVGRPAGPPPPGDPADIVGEALVFAALNNRREVVDYLLDSGADIDARPTRTPPRCTSPSSSSVPRWSATCSTGAPRSPSMTPTTNPTQPAGPTRATMAARRQPRSRCWSAWLKLAEALAGGPIPAGRSHHASLVSAVSSSSSFAPASSDLSASAASPASSVSSSAAAGGTGAR